MSDAAVSISQFPRQFGGVKVVGRVKKGIKVVMGRAIPWLREDLRDHLRQTIKPQRELSRLLGQDRDAALVRIVNSRGKATALNSAILDPSRKADRNFFWGVGDLVRSPAHTYKLRAKAVRAGLFPKRIMFLPPNIPPFSCVGKQFFFARAGKAKPRPRTIERVAAETLSGILNAWGFSK